MEATCNVCGIQNISEPPINLFTDAEIESILQGIYSGRITKDSLSILVYERTAEKLFSGVRIGFGLDDTAFLNELRTNVYIFSAAKDYQQTRLMSSMLTGKDGKRVPFYDFNKQAKEVFNTYNENYLRAEYNSAIAQSRAATQWKQIQNDSGIYNQLKYVTVGDNRVRPEHRVLDGIVRPVQDKFWHTFFPPNGFGCRCTVQQTFGELVTDIRKKPKPTLEDVPEAFRFNPGIEKRVFGKKHPYFDVPRQDKALARNNFNLPTPNA